MAFGNLFMAMASIAIHSYLLLFLPEAAALMPNFWLCGGLGRRFCLVATKRMR